MHMEAETLEREIHVSFIRRYALEERLGPGTDYYGHLVAHGVVTPGVEASGDPGAGEARSLIQGFDLSKIYGGSPMLFKRMLVQTLCQSVALGGSGQVGNKNKLLAKATVALLLRECNPQQHFLDAMQRVQV